MYKRAVRPKHVRTVVTDGPETTVALFWLQAGVLEWVPTPVTGNPDTIVVRLKRE